MIGRLKDMYRKRDGKGWVISFTTDEDFRERFDDLKDFDLDILIDRHREKRSKLANSYFHVLLDKIGKVIGGDEDDIKCSLVLKYGALARNSDGTPMGFMLPQEFEVSKLYKYVKLYDQRMIDGRMFSLYKVYKDTHTMDTKEMSRLIEGTIEEAKELGIETATPAQLAKMKEQWAAYENAHMKKGD